MKHKLIGLSLSLLLGSTCVFGQEFGTDAELFRRDDVALNAKQNGKFMPVANVTAADELPDKDVYGYLIYERGRRDFGIATFNLQDLGNVTMLYPNSSLPDEEDQLLVASSGAYTGKDYYLFYRSLYLGVAAVIVWALCIIFLTYRLLKKVVAYVDELQEATGKLFDSNVDYIELSPELSEIAAKINRLKQESEANARLAKENEQRKNDLIMYLAHDLKTPLSSVMGYLMLLRDEPQISEELREKYLSISLSKAERLEDLINEFFEITRFNLSNITLQYKEIDLTRLLEQLIYEFAPMLREKGLQCDLNAPETLMFRCDADKIQRVFDNLLRNAVIYSFNDTTITIAAEPHEKDVTIIFENCGNTIPREKLSQIFEQFYRLDAARSTSSGGAGLGLAIAKQIVELHKGTITAESTDEKIRFTVTLPLS